MKNASPRTVLPLLLAVAMAVLSALCAVADDTPCPPSPCGNPRPDPEAIRAVLFAPAAVPLDISLSPASACPDSDLPDWLAWFRAQPLPGTSLPDLSAPPPALVPTNDAYPVVARSAATLLRVSPPLDPSPAVPAPTALRYDVFYLPTTNDYPVLLPSAPVFAGAPDYTETIALPGPFPADVPLPSILLPEATSFPYFHLYAFAVRATLLFPGPDPGSAPVPSDLFPPVILPLFGHHSYHPGDAFADADLTADTWKRLSDRTVAALPALPADDSPVVLDPHPLVLSPAALSALASRPVLAQRLLLSGAAVFTPESAPLPLLPLPGTPLSNRPSALFRTPGTTLPESRGHIDAAWGSNPGTAIRPLDLSPVLPALADASPLLDTVPAFFLRAWLAYGLSALLLFGTLLALYRRAPARRTPVWLVLPLLALALALLALATWFLLPRATYARHVLLRVGAADLPEQYCYSSSRLLRFRPAPLRFAYPSPAARLETDGLLSRVPLSLARTPSSTVLDVPPGLPASPVSVDAAWFAPASPPPLRAVRTPVPDASPDAPPAPAPTSYDDLLVRALASRHVVADRDADDAWLRLANDWFRIGPLRAGETAFPSLDAVLKGRTNNPVGDWVPVGDSSFVRGHSSAGTIPLDTVYLPETISAPPYPDPATLPWVLLARESAPTPGAPALPSSPRTSSTTLWLTEFP